MNKRFTLPAFLLVFFSLAWFVAVVISLDRDRSTRHQWPLMAALLLMVIETAIYWNISERNTQRDASLIHVLLLILACASLFLREGVFIYSITRRTLHSGRLLRRIDRVQYTLFACLLIFAHIFFIRVLRSTFSKNNPQQPKSYES
jgi:hypothetical protein